MRICPVKWKIADEWVSVAYDPDPRNLATAHCLDDPVYIAIGVDFLLLPYDQQYAILLHELGHLRDPYLREPTVHNNIQLDILFGSGQVYLWTEHFANAHAFRIAGKAFVKPMLAFYENDSYSGKDPMLNSILKKLRALDEIGE